MDGMATSARCHHQPVCKFQYQRRFSSFSHRMFRSKLQKEWRIAPEKRWICIAKWPIIVAIRGMLQNNLTDQVVTYIRPAGLHAAPPVYGKYVLEEPFLIQVRQRTKFLNNLNSLWGSFVTDSNGYVCKMMKFCIQTNECLYYKSCENSLTGRPSLRLYRMWGTRW